MKSFILPLLVGLACFQARAGQPNTLTPDERAAGWRLLFDGATVEGWRSYGKDAFPASGWNVEDG